jgi:hypothetical protein
MNIRPLQPLFYHRRNPDGTFDSICLTCFLTAGDHVREKDLAVCEQDHRCECGLAPYCGETLTKPN